MREHIAFAYPDGQSVDNNCPFLGDSGSNNEVLRARLTSIRLSNQARQLWAKSDKSDKDAYLPLHQHMTDSGHVARLLWHKWLPQAVTDAISAHAGSPEAGEALFVWLAAGHDIGKATPGFQFKNYTFAEVVRDAGLDVPMTVQHPQYHSLMSQVLLMDWLQAHGWDKSTARTYAIIAGGHHGAPPNSRAEENLDAQVPRQALGGSDWAAVHRELADFVADEADISPYLDDWGSRPLPPALQVVMTGAVIVADWIASNAEYFPLFPARLQSSLTEEQQAERAWDTLGLPPAWSALEELPGDELLFSGRFELGEGARLRPAQQALLDAARHIDEPGLLIMEAPMGAGKTEAALLAAEVLAARFGQGGVAFLLPTMATSNAMYSRLAAWLDRLPDRRGPRQTQTMRLVHSKAALNPDFAALPRWISTSIGQGEVDGPQANVIAHSWLSGRKRSLLANFVVGTVDQLLMAALKAKHVVLRHLGLAGKVVIVDEVHAYDVYMSVFLERALEWLGAHHVPVILLSATLPPQRRDALLRSYYGRTGKRMILSSAPRTSLGVPSYPLVSVGSVSGVEYRSCVNDLRGSTVLVTRLADDDFLLVETIREAMADGGCIGIIRDTVTRAQATYDLLSRELDAHVILAHSRFIACDRQAKDAEIVSLLGKDGNRPERLVVVGTQVLEQSLDIDFDLLITDIAPMDLLLQRMGRLQRHDRHRPPKLARARCVITGITDADGPAPTFSSGIAKVYSSALLLRTVAVLRDRAEIELPTDIAPLVEQVYASGFDVPAGWEDAMAEAGESLAQETAEKECRARDWLLPSVPRRDLTGWLYAELKDADDDNARGQAAVRDAQDSVEVIVVQRAPDGTIHLLPWVEERANVEFECCDKPKQKMSEMPRTVLDMNTLSQFGRDIPTVEVPGDEVARLAATCTVSLPPALSQPWLIGDVIKELESSAFEGWQQSPWLRGQLPLVLSPDGTATIHTGGGDKTRAHRLRYDRELGLQVLKEEES